MAFQTPITIATALERVRRNDYVLPGIQREFVWRHHQIEALFDSLLRGYPIGTFLFWQVKANHVGDFKFYRFLRPQALIVFDKFHIVSHLGKARSTRCAGRRSGRRARPTRTW